MAAVEQDSRERWKRIIKYLLNIDIGDNSEQMKQTKQTFRQILQFANYMELTKVQVPTFQMPAQMIHSG